MKSKRFDYVKYDSISGVTQQQGKKLVEQLESYIESAINCPRSKATALTKLEEVYMWIGKGVRNDQITRNGNAELDETRAPLSPETIKRAFRPILGKAEFAYKHKLSGEIVYKPHAYASNGILKRAPELDRNVQ